MVISIAALETATTSIKPRSCEMEQLGAQSHGRCIKASRLPPSIDCVVIKVNDASAPALSPWQLSSAFMLLTGGAEPSRHWYENKAWCLFGLSMLMAKRYVLAWTTGAFSLVSLGIGSLASLQHSRKSGSPSQRRFVVFVVSLSLRYPTAIALG